MDTAIVCRELECGYHGHSILRDIDLVLQKGESVALLGMNGAGKSTLIKTLAGELKPLKGGVEIVSPDGTVYDRRRLSPAQAARLIAIVPQEEVNPFAFSVLEIVAMGRLAYSSSIFDSEDDLVAAREAMRTVECDALANRSITELSGGEKQRVLIARALAQQTPIVLLDEPTSHLDPPHQLSMSQLIASLATDGKCVVTAVHDLNLASILANRALLISNGRIVADGSVEEVLQSDALEECYQAKFERVRTLSGRLVVIPEMTTSVSV